MKKLYIIILTVVMFTALTITTSALSRTNWAVDYADFIYNNSILDGTTASLSTTAKITRGEFALAFSRIHGVTVSNYVTTGFSDVPYGSQYAGAVKWASENGLVGGYGNVLFGVNDYITRQDAVVLAYRYLVTFNGITLPLTYSAPSYSDYSSISNYALTAVVALHRAGIISGNDEGNFLPLNQIKTTEACVLLTNTHGFKHNTTANSITVYVKDRTGAATANAAVFCYNSNGGNPYSLTEYKTNSSGFVTISSLNSSYQYALNVFGYYTGTFTPDYVSPSKMYVIMSLPQDLYDFALSASYNRSTLWPHSTCNHASWYYHDWCPLAYAQSSQNFGWRYLNGVCEFHQGMDYGTYNSNEEIKNTFGETIDVRCTGFDIECGYYSQLSYDNKYITFQHLKEQPSSTTSIAPNQTIGISGSTGTSQGIHVHVTVSKNTYLYPANNVRTDFIDPRIFFE